jgi:thiol:disulfide interchange protein DsbC
MIIRTLKVYLAPALLVLGLSVQAGEPVSEAVDKQIRGVLEPAVGQQVQSVQKSEVPGLNTVRFTSGASVYATDSGEFFITGDVHKVTADGYENLTENLRNEQRIDLIAKVDKKDMIVFPAAGETRAYINVFTDVTCFYCQKLHKEVPKLNKNGVEVRYLAYPRSGLSSAGYRKLATAWCAENRQETLTKLKANETVDESVCNPNPVAEQFQLGQAVGVRGTPAIVTESGKLINGYLVADELLANLGLK